MPRTTAQNVILQILRAGEGEWSGKLKLHKAFYFAHLFYANERPGVLTDWPIARLQHGPGIHDGERLIEEMAAEGLLTIESVHEGPYPECRYRLTDQTLATAPDMDEDARAAVNQAAAFCKDRTAADLSQLTHDRSRSWHEGETGDLLHIYVDTIPEEEYRQREQRLEELSEQLPRILGEPRNETGG
jgi:uncharacterized phage-associated protein